MIAMDVIVQSLFSDHGSVADWTNILEGSREMYVLYVIHNIVLLSTSLATKGALKQASLLKNFFFYVLQQDTSIIHACNRSDQVFWLRRKENSGWWGRQSFIDSSQWYFFMWTFQLL